MEIGLPWDWARALLGVTVRSPGEQQGLRRHCVTVSYFSLANASLSQRRIVPNTSS